MVPTNFEESNGSLGPPQGMTDEEVQHLSIWRGHYPTGKPVIISCWKLTKEELDEFNRTGRIWLHIWGHTMPPAYLGTANPFKG